jgi:hypothetical protein
VSIQGLKALVRVTSSYAQVCATVRESVDLLAVAAAGAVQILSKSDRDSISAALVVGDDSASRCFAMLNRILAAAGRNNEFDNTITGTRFSNHFASIKSVLLRRMLRTNARILSAMLHACKSIKPVGRVWFVDCFAVHRTPHRLRCGVKRPIANY